MASRSVSVALVASCLVAASACSAGRSPVVSPRETGGPVRELLANGIPVIVDERRASDLVAVQLWVKAGARDEAASELGLAHYLEHMLFKGTPTRPPGFVDREIERVGGRINAGTSLDFTYYHATLPASRAAAAIELVADVGVNATLDETVLEQEKRVVLEEMRLHDDNPRRALVRRLYALTFAGHPYARPVIGREELIRNLDRDTLVSFYRRRYVPEALSLVVVGAVRPADVITVATRALGRLPRTGTQRLPPPAPPAPRGAREEATRPGTLAYLGMAWLGPKIDHADTAAVDVLASILGQSRASRLTQSLRESLGLVNSITLGYDALEAAGIVTLIAQLDPVNVDRVEREVLRELRRVRDQGVSDDELARAMSVAEARHEFAIEAPEGRAYALGQAETIWRLEDELAYVDRLRSVTREQVMLAARRYLDLDRYARVAVMPARTQ